MSLSTHVLDTSEGRPAAGIRVRLELHDDGWRLISDGRTDDDGRISGWDTPGPGVYRLVFEVGGQFYPEVTVTFRVADDSHHHVPLLISPYGYSTYRGS
ncbi:hydroxyisourate hydrolase [Actinophytocola oryzae]|uniref:5-hydroxyisourate hydrolase n=1 Tax=Actinophytocola oryzae TaxID=502181 RepID=A0A4R7VYK2_9PSEU|nr:hydroxyisourate hydrolase [Actinophytocola oryzae]TDV55260.1 5-hydroxyisourate hydrolase [Actinophytocola oryzae]